MIVRLSALFLLTALLGGCELLETGSDSDAKPLPSISPEMRTVVEGTNAFGFDLFRTLNRGNRSEDARLQLISPVGISASLAILLEGARGTTRDRIGRVLYVPDGREREALDAYSRLLLALGSVDRHYLYESLQALILRWGIEVNDTYVDIPDRLVGARLRPFDFSRPQAMRILNEWIEEETRGRVPELIYQLPPQDVLVMGTAAWVAGTWRYRFDGARTGPGPFTRFDGTQIEMPFMRQTGRYPYTETDSMRMVSVPYGDSLFALHLVLPREEVGVHRLIQEVDLERWRRWTSRLTPTYLDLAIPKLRLSYAETLNNELIGVGLADVFAPATANFEGIGPGHLSVSRVRHQSVLDASRESGLRAPPRPEGEAEPRIFRVDRPFFLVVSERYTGSIVFMGRVAGRPPDRAAR